MEDHNCPMSASMKGGIASSGNIAPQLTSLEVSDWNKVAPGGVATKPQLEHGEGREAACIDEEVTIRSCWCKNSAGPSLLMRRSLQDCQVILKRKAERG